MGSSSGMTLQGHNIGNSFFRVTTREEPLSIFYGDHIIKYNKRMETEQHKRHNIWIIVLQGPL